MQIVTLLNEKGGVGKTTLATHIAAGLAIRGLRVVLVDTDPQAHSTVAFGIPKQPKLYDLLVRDAEWNEVLIPIPADRYSAEDVDGGLALVASNMETRGIPTMVDDTAIFGERAEEMQDLIDVMVVDTPPTPSMLHGSIYMSTDYMLYPTKCAYFSFDGLQESIRRFGAANTRREKEGKPHIKALGIVPTLYRGNTVEHSENLKQLRSQYGDLVWEPITESILWEEASSLAVPVWMVGTGRSVNEINEVIDRVMDEIYVEA